MHAVRREIVILPLFAVRNDRRACGFKPLNGVANRIFIERREVRILTVAFCDALDEINGSRDTANWLGGYSNWNRLSHTYRLFLKHTGISILAFRNTPLFANPSVVDIEAGPSAFGHIILTRDARLVQFALRYSF